VLRSIVQPPRAWRLGEAGQLSSGKAAKLHEPQLRSVAGPAGYQGHQRAPGLSEQPSAAGGGTWQAVTGRPAGITGNEHQLYGRCPENFPAETTCCKNQEGSLSIQFLGNGRPIGRPPSLLIILRSRYGKPADSTPSQFNRE